MPVQSVFACDMNRHNRRHARRRAAAERQAGRQAGRRDTNAVCTSSSASSSSSANALCRCCTRPGSNRLAAEEGLAPDAAAEPGGTYLLPLLPGVLYICDSASVRQADRHAAAARDAAHNTCWAPTAQKAGDTGVGCLAAAVRGVRRRHRHKHHSVAHCMW